MNKKKVLIISDGNGVDNEFLKWPSLLQILTTKTLNIVNRSIVGASNELMLYQLIDSLNEKYDSVIIQWAPPQRVDIVANEFWQTQAKVDPTYHFNIVSSLGKEWWVSSKSENTYIQKYHQLYIEMWQAKQRSYSYMLAAAEILKSQAIPFVFSLCYALEFDNHIKPLLENYTWAWHEKYKGINDFRFNSKYFKFDKGYPQPCPLIGLEWINQVLSPISECFAYDQKTYYNVEKSLLKNV